MQAVISAVAVRAGIFALACAVCGLQLVGCRSLGLEAPQSFEQRIAYAYSVHTAVLNAAASSLEANVIPKEDGAHALKVADESRAFLDAARIAARAGDLGTAEGRLLLATSLLRELQDYLRGKSP